MSALKQKKKKEEIGRRKKESRWKVDTKTLTGSGKRERENVEQTASRGKRTKNWTLIKLYRYKKNRKK